jgi:dTDP-glucose pyrophosphorylase
MSSVSIIEVNTAVRDLAYQLERHPILFVRSSGKLVGSITNGDFRRAIARGASLEENADVVMNRSPVTVRANDGYLQRLEKVRTLPKGLRYLPVLDEASNILEVVSDRALMRIPNMVVIMAGGLGSRLKELTANTPKPMLKIGEKPILQLIIEQFRRAGISRFVISVNFKANVIIEHFGDGSKFDVEITYLHETERMGTAGCLSMLPELPKDPFFVINGDVLTDINPHYLLNKHKISGARATVCSYRYRFPVPYGVIDDEDGRVLRIREKPEATFDINAGIYIINPDCVNLVPVKQFFDMTSLLDKILSARELVGTVALTGFWIDIGNVDDFQRANNEYPANDMLNVGFDEFVGNKNIINPRIKM